VLWIPFDSIYDISVDGPQAKKKRMYVACKTEVSSSGQQESKDKDDVPEPTTGPKLDTHLPVKRLGWILPGKSVKKSVEVLEQIGKAVAEIGFDAELDTDDFYVVAREEDTDADMFLVTLFQQDVKGNVPNLLLDVQRLALPTHEFNDAYRNLRVALRELNAWDGPMMATA